MLGVRLCQAYFVLAMLLALVLALVVGIASIVLQFVMLSKFKKRSKNLCQLEFSE